MARIEDGELYLEIKGATEDQLRSGVAAARRSFEEAGVDMAAAFAATARVDEAYQAELAWEQGITAEPAEVSGADLDLSDAADAAWAAAVHAAGYDPREHVVVGQLGLVEP